MGDYRAHEQFIAPARAHAQIWRLAVGICLAYAVFYGLSVFVFGAIMTVSRARGDVAFLDAILLGSTPAAMLFLLVSFSFMAAGAAVSARVLHHRSPLTLLGPVVSGAGRDFLRCMALLVPLFGVLLIAPPWQLDPPLIPNVPLGLWLALLPLSLLALLIQTGAEEIVFRGYLQQQLAARFRSPLIWMGLPSALFALGHYAPHEAGDNTWLMVFWAGVFGLLMADLTARAGNLGPAIAVHLVTNFSSLLITSLPDSLYGLSLYVLPYSMADTEALRSWMMVDFATILVCWLTARLAIRR